MRPNTPRVPWLRTNTVNSHQHVQAAKSQLENWQQTFSIRAVNFRFDPGTVVVVDITIEPEASWEKLDNHAPSTTQYLDNHVPSTTQYIGEITASDTQRTMQIADFNNQFQFPNISAVLMPKEVCKAALQAAQAVKAKKCCGWW